jgi:hypothetical protein
MYENNIKISYKEMMKKDKRILKLNDTKALK